MLAFHCVHVICHLVPCYRRESNLCIANSFSDVNHSLIYNIHSVPFRQNGNFCVCVRCLITNKFQHQFDIFFAYMRMFYFTNKKKAIRFRSL